MRVPGAAEIGAEPAGEVFAEVHDVHAGLGLGDGLGGNRAVDADGRGELGDERAGLVFAFGCGGPAGIVEGGQVPAGGLLAGIEDFAEVDVVAEQAAGGGFPRGVGGDGLDAAVEVFEPQVGDELGAADGQGVAEVEFVEELHRQGIVPAVAERDADGVGAFLQQGGHIIDAIIDMFCVVCPAGIEDAIADGLAVDRGIVVAQAGDVEPRGDRLLGELEALAEHRGRIIFEELFGFFRGGLAVADPLAFPVFRVHHAGFESRRHGIRAVSFTVPDADFP